MTSIKPIPAHTTTLGDAAVDGLLNGAVAGLAMALYLVLAMLAQGQAPWAVLSAFDASARNSPLVGLVMHLAVSGVYGALFGLLWKSTHRLVPASVPGWLIGLFYGLVLYLLAELVLLPSTATALRDIPFYHFGIAHLIYGAVLGWLIGRLDL